MKKCETKDLPKIGNIKDSELLKLICGHCLTGPDISWNSDKEDPFNDGVKVSPKNPYVEPIPPFSGKLGFLVLKGGVIEKDVSIVDMYEKDYFFLNSVQIAPSAPAGTIYASFHPGQVPKVMAGKKKPFCFFMQVSGKNLPQTFDFKCRTPASLPFETLHLTQIIDGLYCGIVFWSEGLLEIFGTVLQPLKFYWAQLRRINAK